MSQVACGVCRVPFGDLGSFGTPEVMVILGLFLPWKLRVCLNFGCFAAVFCRFWFEFSNSSCLTVSLEHLGEGLQC